MMAAFSSSQSFAEGSLYRGHTREIKSTIYKLSSTSAGRGFSSSWRRRRCIVKSCSQQEGDAKPAFSFDFSTLQNRDVESIRRANLNARRRLIQNRGVPNIYPQVYGQATKIEKVWKEWKSAEKDSYSRGLEYLTPEVIDPEDEIIIANDGLFIEKKYPDIKTKSTIITKEGELLH